MALRGLTAALASSSSSKQREEALLNLNSFFDEYDKDEEADETDLDDDAGKELRTALHASLNKCLMLDEYQGMNGILCLIRSAVNIDKDSFITALMGGSLREKLVDLFVDLIEDDGEDDGEEGEGWGTVKRRNRWWPGLLAEIFLAVAGVGGMNVGEEVREEKVWRGDEEWNKTWNDDRLIQNSCTSLRSSQRWGGKLINLLLELVKEGGRTGEEGEDEDENDVGDVRLNAAGALEAIFDEAGNAEWIVKEQVREGLGGEGLERSDSKVLHILVTYNSSSPSSQDNFISQVMKILGGGAGGADVGLSLIGVVWNLVKRKDLTKSILSSDPSLIPTLLSFPLTSLSPEVTKKTSPPSSFSPPTPELSPPLT